MELYFFNFVTQKIHRFGKVTLFLFFFINKNFIILAKVQKSSNMLKHILLNLKNNNPKIIINNYGIL